MLEFSREKINGYIFQEREKERKREKEVYFKELACAAGEAGKPKISRVGPQA